MKRKAQKENLEIKSPKYVERKKDTEKEEEHV